MSAPAERTVLVTEKKWQDGDSMQIENPFSHEFDPKETAKKDSKEIIWRYEQQIKAAIAL